MTYQWKPGAQLTAIDPEKVGRLFEQLRKKNNGNLTPEDVLEAATPAKSPIHRFFEWNDTDAAQRYRQEQARYLIRMLVVVNQEGSVPLRAVVSVRPGTSTQPVYRDREEVMADPELREQVIVQALREYNALTLKYYDVEELHPIADVVEKVRADCGLLTEG